MNTVKTMQVLDGRTGAIPHAFSVILALKRKQAFNKMIYNFSSCVDKMFWLLRICQREQHSPLLILSEK